MCVAIQNLVVRVDTVRQEREGEIAASAREVMNFQPLDLL
jgi:hypothetical protein